MNNFKFNTDRIMSVPVWNNEHSASIQLDLVSGIQFSFWINPDASSSSVSTMCEMKIVQSSFRSFEKRLKVTVNCGESPYILLLNLNTKARTFIEIINQSLSLNNDQKSYSENLEFVSRDYIEVIDDQISLISLINRLQFKPFLFVKDQSNILSGVFSFQNGTGELISDLETKMLITETNILLNEYCLIHKGISFQDYKNAFAEEELFSNMLSGSGEIDTILGADSKDRLINTLSKAFYKVNRNLVYTMSMKELNAIKETCIFFRMLKEISI